MIKKKIIFLDRDNTINQDPGYISSPDQVVLLPRVGEALKLLADAGYGLIVVSNQSGVGRGFFTEDAAQAVNDRINECLAPFGVRIDGFYMCFHHPDQACDCRKPGTALFAAIERDFAVDTGRSYMVGDKESDVQFGLNTGIPAIKLTHYDGRSSESALCNVTDLYDAACFIISRD